MKKLVLASNNAGKLAELAPLMAACQLELIAQSAYAVPDCPEPHITFVENALAKARHASSISGLAALADDSGICAVALGGAPGVHSARFAGSTPKSDSANNAKMSALLANEVNKTVYYVCVLVLVRHADDPQPLIAQGTWYGQWQHQAAGQYGFGYDPHFYSLPHAQTAAQMTPTQKNQHSHRALAVRRLQTMIAESDLAL